MKRLLIVSAILLLTMTATAQGVYSIPTVYDTIMRGDPYYMFQQVPDKITWDGVELEGLGGVYFPEYLGGTEVPVMPFGSSARKGKMSGTMLQSYTTAAPTRVYGVAVTMEPYWYSEEQNKLLPGFPVTALEKEKYRAVLSEVVYDGDSVVSVSTLDSVRYDDSSLVIQRWFRYPYFTHIDHEVPMYEDVELSPVYEFYFDSLNAHIVDGTFHVGTKYDTKVFCMDTFRWRPPFDVNERLYPAEFLCFYTTPDTSFDPGRRYLRSTSVSDTGTFYDAFRCNDTIYDDHHSPVFHLGWWGYIFPITGLRCKEELGGLELTGQGLYYAGVRWNGSTEGPGSEYGVRLSYGDYSFDTIVYTCDTSILFENLKPGQTYRCAVSKGCRYTTKSCDTLALGPWTDYVMFTMAPDTTKPVDTTVVDTTGIRMVLVGDADFSLRPNPAGETAEVTMQYAVAERAELTLLDMQGRVVRRRTLPAGTRTATLELGGLPSGAYLLKMVTPQGLATRRLLKR